MPYSTDADTYSAVLMPCPACRSFYRPGPFGTGRIGGHIVISFRGTFGKSANMEERWQNVVPVQFLKLRVMRHPVPYELCHAPCTLHHVSPVPCTMQVEFLKLRYSIYDAKGTSQVRRPRLISTPRPGPLRTSPAPPCPVAPVNTACRPPSRRIISYLRRRFHHPRVLHHRHPRPRWPRNVAYEGSRSPGCKGPVWQPPAAPLAAITPLGGPPLRLDVPRQELQRTPLQRHRTILR